MHFLGLPYILKYKKSLFLHQTTLNSHLGIKPFKIYLLSLQEEKKVQGWTLKLSSFRLFPHAPLYSPEAHHSVSERNVYDRKSFILSQTSRPSFSLIEDYCTPRDCKLGFSSHPTGKIFF